MIITTPIKSVCTHSWSKKKILEKDQSMNAVKRPLSIHPPLAKTQASKRQLSFCWDAVQK